MAMSVACLLLLVLGSSFGAARAQNWDGVAMPRQIVDLCSGLNTCPSTDLKDPEHSDYLINLGCSIIMGISTAPGFEQTLHFAEIFSGAGRITSACRKSGLIGYAFDREIDKTQDMSTLHGMVLAGLLISSIVPGGVAWFAPQCSTWLAYMSAAIMQRKESNRYAGNTARKDVRDANACAIVLAFLLGFAHSRDVRVVIENPTGSNLWRFPYLYDRAKEVQAYLYTTYGACFGWNSLKPFTLLSTMPLKLLKKHILKSKASATRALKESGASPAKLVSKGGKKKAVDERQ